MTSTFQSERNTAGHLIVRHVPIFVECSRGETSFDAEWIEQAVQKARLSASEGYLPPLHVRHHGDSNEPVRAAGFFKITSIGHIRFKGDTKLAVFADLTITDPDVGVEVLTARLPYRSVEIFDVDAPSIDSLALLDHEAPYLELPMLMVAEPYGDQTQPEPMVASATFRNPLYNLSQPHATDMVACFRRGRSANIIWSGEESKTMSKPKTKRKQFTATDPVEPIITDPAVVMANGDDDEKKDDDKGEDMQDEGMNIAAVVEAITSGAISMADMDAIMEAIGSMKGAEETEEVAEEAPASVPVPGEAMSAKMAKLAGENAALKTRMDEKDQEQQRRLDVADALKRLEDRPMGSDLEGKLELFHNAHGAQAFKAYVDSMVSTFAAVNNSNVADAGERFASQADMSSKVALTYTDQGAHAVERAAGFSKIWKELNSRGHVRMDEERYVTLNMQQSDSPNA